ncbi:hypothetical protein SDC9_206884 [bioreactor metagenome]|uniref:Uncharacterized protein n=1 Tax=bioreactor metagenome TaxID=1076179 RepID=A0A645JFP2_9ZZZZ
MSDKDGRIGIIDFLVHDDTGIVLFLVAKVHQVVPVLAVVVCDVSKVPEPIENIIAKY